MRDIEEMWPELVAHTDGIPGKTKPCKWCHEYGLCPVGSAILLPESADAPAGAIHAVAA